MARQDLHACSQIPIASTIELYGFNLQFIKMDGVPGKLILMKHIYKTIALSRTI